MGTEQNFAICVIDILDCEKDTTMRLDALVCQTVLQDLPGRYRFLFCLPFP